MEYNNLEETKEIAAEQTVDVVPPVDDSLSKSQAASNHSQDNAGQMTDQEDAKSGDIFEIDNMLNDMDRENPLQERTKKKKEREKKHVSLVDKDREHLEQSHSQIEKINTYQNKLQQQLEEIQQVKLREPQFQQREIQKPWEQNYADFLEELTGMDHTIVRDKESQLVEAQIQEKNLRESFLKELTDKDKIVTQSVQINHFVKYLVEETDDDMVAFGGKQLHPETLDGLRQFQDQKIDVKANQAEDGPDLTLNYYIHNVDVEHYSINSDNVFMIVKSVEEASCDNSFKVVQNVIRIFKMGDEEIKENHVDSEEIKKKKLKKQKLRQKQMEEMNIKGKKLIDKPKQEFKLMKTILIAGSGVIKEKKIPQRQPQTAVFKGKYMYIYQKEWVDKGEKGILPDFNLLKIDLTEVGTRSSLHSNEGITKLDQYSIKMELLGKEYDVYFIQNCCQKGIKMDYTQVELDELDQDEDHDKFLDGMYIQIMDHKNENQPIYQGKDLLNPVVSRKKDPNQNKAKVTREEKYLKTYREYNAQKNIHTFFIMFRTHYLITQYSEDEEIMQGLGNKFHKFDYQVRPISKKEQEKKDNPNAAKGGKGAKRPPPQNKGGKQLQKIQEIRQQIRHVQSVRVLKYDKSRNSKADLLSYFGLESATENIFDNNDNDDEEDNDEQNELDPNDLIEINYFIDERGYIQILATEDMLESRNKFEENQKIEEEDKREEVVDIKTLREHYWRHVCAKIGYPKFQKLLRDEQIRVSYVKDELSYDDVRFTGTPLLEHFVHESTDYDTPEVQTHNSDYIVASVGYHQYLYIFQRIRAQEASNEKQGGGNTGSSLSSEYTIDVLSINNYQKYGNQSRQFQQILSLLNNFNHQKLDHVPPVRLNKKYRQVMSNWFSIQSCDQPERKDDTKAAGGDDTTVQLVNLLDGKTRTKISQADYLTECQANVMAIELKDGSYARVKIWEKSLLDNIPKSKENQQRIRQLGGSQQRSRFTILPYTYFSYVVPAVNEEEIDKHYYIFFFQLRLFFRKGFDKVYNFCCENLIVRYDEEEIRMFVKNKKALLSESSLAYTIDKNQSEDKTEKNRRPFVLSGRRDLQDYVLNDRFAMPGFQDEYQYLLKFEQVMDSKISQKIMPFLIVEKTIPAFMYNDQTDKFVENEELSGMTLQALMVDMESVDEESSHMFITNSKRISPAVELRKSLQNKKAIHLWRMSDIFYDKKADTYFIHYQVSFKYVQHIDRIQIWEYQTQISFKPELVLNNRSFQASKIALIEKLISNLKTCHYNERLRLSENQKKKDEEMEIGQNKEDDPIDMKQASHRSRSSSLAHERGQLNKKEVLIAAKAVLIPEYGIRGLITNAHSNNMAQYDDFICPNSQNFRSPYLLFGYEKYSNNNPREFDLNFYSRLSIDCILNQALFTGYERQLMLKTSIQKMMQMKPVQLKDFDMLLIHTYQTFKFEDQCEFCFFMPQEMFLGQTMLDVNLIKADYLNLKIKGYLKRIEQIRVSNMSTRKEKEHMGKGSLVDMVLQNNEMTSLIMDKSLLDVQDYLVISQDFSLKSQIMRSFESGANSSLKVLFQNIFKINEYRYVSLIEHDLVIIMSEMGRVKEIAPLFEISNEENQNESEFNDSVNCNFEKILKQDRLPPTWFQGETQTPKYSKDIFEDERENQEEEIVDDLIEQGDAAPNKEFEVRHSICNFQNIQFGEKIRKINQCIILEIQEKIAEQQAQNDSKNGRFAQMMNYFKKRDSQKDQNEAEKVPDPSLKTRASENKQYEPTDQEVVEHPLEKISYSFDDLQLALILSQNDSADLYELGTIQNIIDTQFIKTRKFFAGLIQIYTIGFFIPYFILNMELINDYRWTYFILITCCVTQFFFFIIEIIQVKAQWEEYFDSLFNLFDLLQFAFFIVQISLKKFNYHEIKTLSDKMKDEPDLYIYQLITEIIMIFMIMIKLQNFFRMNQEIGFLGQMVTATFFDLLPFLAYFFYFIVIFSVIYSCLQINPNNSGDYQGINIYVAVFIMTFRNSIGDLAPPDYTFWLDGENDNVKINDTVKRVMVFSIWVIWVLKGIVMIIVLLNFLIAVISQTYEKIFSQMIVCMYTDKAELNLEYFQIMGQIQKLRNSVKEDLKFMIFTVSSDIIAKSDDSSWLGFVSAIKKHINRNTQKVREHMKGLHVLVEEIQTSNKATSHIQEQSSRKQNNIKEILKQINKNQNDIEESYKNITGHSSLSEKVF